MQIQPRFGAIEIIGHRGDFYRDVENTVGSFHSAFAQGADAVEMDVQIPKDGGVPVIYHDDVLGGAGFRIGGPGVKQGSINSYTRQELAYVNFYRDAYLAGLSQKAGVPLPPTLSSHVRIPSLDEFLTVFPKDKKVYIELKRPTKIRKHRDGLEQAVVDWIQRNRLEDRAVVISFNVRSLRKIKQLAPQLKTGLDIEGIGGTSFLAMAVLKLLLKVDYWLPSFEYTSQKVIGKAHALGLKIAPWVYHDNMKQEQERLKTLVKLDLDGIITNQPGYLKDLLSGRQSPSQEALTPIGEKNK